MQSPVFSRMWTARRRIVADKNGIVTYDFYILPAYSYVVAPPEQSQALWSAENYYCHYSARTGIDFHIGNRPEYISVFLIYHLLVSQISNTTVQKNTP